MSETRTVSCPFHVRRRGRGARKELVAGAAPPAAEQPAGRVPRVTRLLALAIRFEQLVRAGEIAHYAQLARLGHVSRARITQIMNLLLLAPDIQEEILWLPRVERGPDPIHLRQLLPMAALPGWRQQRQVWRRLRAS